MPVIIQDQIVVDSTNTGPVSVFGKTDGNTIWLTPNAPPGIYEHELGHVYDIRAMSEEKRAAFLKIIGKPELPWTADESRIPGASMNELGSEWFADAYAMLASLAKIDLHWEYSVGTGTLTGKKLVEVGRFLRNEPVGFSAG